MSILPKNLTAKLLGKKIVNVKTSDGETFEFEIQKVNIESFAGEGIAKLEKVVGKSEEEIQKMFVDQFKSKEISKIVSPVLLAGVVSPAIVEKSVNECNQEKEVPLNVLLIDLQLATNLYMEILQISIKKEK